MTQITKYTKYNRKQIGQLGELIARKFLSHKGYKIIDHNWGNKYGELDVICENFNSLIFVEVKTKKGISFGTPEEMISSNKLNKIHKMAKLFINQNNNYIKYPFSIDAVCIVLSKSLKPISISHHKSITQ